MVDDANRVAEEERLRRAVYNAIVTLSECVIEATLQKMLNYLDQTSWMEVVEERYLGRICGFPLCANSLEVKKSQKYRIDLKNKKLSDFLDPSENPLRSYNVFERSAETDKFCCQNCFLRSAAIRAQLETEPLWIRGGQRVKVFDLNAGDIKHQQQQQRNTCCFEFIDDQELITSLEILKIGDTAESDDEDTNNEINTDDEKIVHAPEEFYNLCRSYLTIKPTISNNEKSVVVSTVEKFTDRTVTKMEFETEKKENEQFSESEKLARIRNKYYQTKLRRPPEIIEAKPLSLQLNNKVSGNSYEDFRKTMSEWCGPETICYLQCYHGMDLRNNGNEVVAEARSIIARFCAGDRSINKVAEGDIFLPPVDNVDQAKQRISVLNELLKPSWRILEGMLGINGCGQQALKIISTFRLSAKNVFLERKACDLAVAVIFRLLAYCDTSLMDFYPSGGTVSPKLMQYLEKIGCDAKCYFEILSIVINKLE